MEAGLYQLNDQLLEAGLGSDIMRGVQNLTMTVPIPYVLNPQLEVESAVLSTAAMDGGDGGWPVLYSNNPLQNNNLFAAIDEDQIRDIERNHTTEQVAYLAFGDHASVSGLKAFDPKTSNKDTHKPSSLTLYPNPLTKGQRIILRSSDRQPIDLSNLSIVSLEGKVIPFTIQVKSNFRVEIDAPLQSGMYFIFLTEGRGVRTVKKLVVNR